MEYWNLVIENKADNQDVVEIFVDGIIGSRWDEYSKEYVTLTKDQLQKQLKALGDISAKQIVVYINSYGGDVNHGVSMHDMLAMHKSTVITDQRGHTASAASILAQCASPGMRKMSANALTLAHNASTVAWGDKNEMKTALSDLEKVDESLAKIYSKRSGKPVADCLELMNRMNGRGEWLTADEAKDWGLVDEVYEPTKMAACIDGDLLKKFGLPDVPKSKLDLVNSKYIPKNENSMEIKWKDVWTSIKSFFDFSTPGDEKSNINAEKTIDNLNAELTARQTTIDTLTTERDAANASLATANAEKTTLTNDLATANATIETHVATIAAHEATIVTLKNNAGAPAANPIVNTDPKNPDEDEKPELMANSDDFMTNVNNIRKNFLGKK